MIRCRSRLSYHKGSGTGTGTGTDAWLSFNPNLRCFSISNSNFHFHFHLHLHFHFELCRVLIGWRGEAVPGRGMSEWQRKRKRKRHRFFGRGWSGEIRSGRIQVTTKTDPSLVMRIKLSIDCPFIFVLEGLYEHDSNNERV